MATTTYYLIVYRPILQSLFVCTFGSSKRGPGPRDSNLAHRQTPSTSTYHCTWCTACTIHTLGTPYV